MLGENNDHTQAQFTGERTRRVVAQGSNGRRKHHQGAGESARHHEVIDGVVAQYRGPRRSRTELREAKAEYVAEMRQQAADLVMEPFTIAELAADGAEDPILEAIGVADMEGKGLIRKTGQRRSFRGGPLEEVYDLTWEGKCFMVWAEEAGDDAVKAYFDEDAGGSSSGVLS